MEYDNSLTVKNYLFQFFSFYSCLFYVAFFKGRFTGTPDSVVHIFGMRGVHFPLSDSYHNFYFFTAKVAVQQAIRSTCLSVCLCVYNVEINLLKAHQLIRVQFETT